MCGTSRFERFSQGPVSEYLKSFGCAHGAGRPYAKSFRNVCARCPRFQLKIFINDDSVLHVRIDCRVKPLRKVRSITGVAGEILFRKRVKNYHFLP